MYGGRCGRELVCMETSLPVVVSRDIILSGWGIVWKRQSMGSVLLINGIWARYQGHCGNDYLLFANKGTNI